MKTIFDFYSKKKNNEKISMITCYDYSFARLINKSNIDVILVGDSLAMTMHGFPNTLSADNELMKIHTAAVAKGAPDKFIVGDLPFLSYRKDLNSNMNAVDLLMKAGAHAVKLEGALGNLELIKHLTQSGVPVMGHLGLTPQSIHALGGFRVQGKTEEAQNEILDQAQLLQESGCFSVVLECVPQALATKITQTLSIPTIGIGAGANTDGQVLVLQDLLGMNTDFSPKFVRRFMNAEELFLKAFNQFHTEVKEVTFPTEKESYS
ncbi:MAG TPA: 3-methyl-2-oxobutanoate hydroxymethyltransferase [Pseudobdellovibrionaceae bacterium]|nr:3-methyl-2-oxobutanoate hydroxymethyltransferase [Pseudobdellovibrionaceae bacterium]